MTSTAKDERLSAAAQAAENPDALAVLFEELNGDSRRKRQSAAATIALVAGMKPEAIADYSNDLVDALSRPEAQTRWECLDALTALVDIESRSCDKGIVGAEAALFDEDSGPLRLAAVRFLCKLGATTENRSRKVWPLLDEAIQCYHGDLEFQDMLVAVIAFSEGKLADDVAAELKARMSFDAKSGKGTLKKRAAQIVANLE